MTTFLFAGNGPYSNRGCEAIVRGTTAILREQLPDSKFISSYFAREGCDDAAQETDPAILHRPFPWLKPYTAPWICEQLARRILDRPFNADSVTRTLRTSFDKVQMVMMLGGDNYTLDYGNPRIFFYMNKLALAADLPVVIWGASIGPFSQDREIESWATQRLRQLTLIGVREKETMAYLQGIGVQDNVILMADPAFLLQPQAVSLPGELETALNEGVIGLNLSPLLHRFMPPDLQQGNPLARWESVAGQIIDAVRQRVQRRIILIPHVTSYTNNLQRDDFLFLKRIWYQLGQPRDVLLLDARSLNAAQTKWVIGQTLIFAGARTHSTLAAISSGVPTICIGYSLKARGIANDVYGHLNWMVDNQTLMRQPVHLAQMVAEMVTQEADLRKHLAERVPVFQDRVRKASERIINLSS